MKIKLPHIEKHQQDVFDRIKHARGTGETFVIKSPRQSGKTYTLKYILLYYALQYPKSKSALISPVGYQTRRVQRELYKDLSKTNLLESSNLSDGYIIFKNGSEIHFKSAEQGENLRGLTVSGILILDEAAFITDEVYEICMPFCNVFRAPKLLVSSPLFKSGFFYEEFSDILNTVFDWSRDKYDLSMFLSEEDMERYKKKYTKQKYLTEIMGEFVEAWSDVFGDFKKRIAIPTDMTPVAGGLDWGAGTDNDETCLTLLNEDRQIVYRWTASDMDPTAQVQVLASIINSFPTLRALYIEKNSIGNVYLSMLKKAVRNTSILHVFDTTNENKREMIENLIVAFEQGTIGIDDDPILHAQLAGFQVKKIKKGYTYGNDKDSTHDDRILSLAFAYSMFTQQSTVSIGFSKK